MVQTKKKPKYGGQYSLGQKLLLGGIGCGVLVAVILVCALAIGSAPKVKQTDETTYGIDVARFQGTIDWEQAARDGVDFAMVRVGYRSMTSGEIIPDSNARYNLQEAQKYGVKLGVYFFSTAVSEAEAKEEAEWVADFIAQYPITYPVAYDCEGFTEPESRQYHLSREERTDIALAFLKAVEKRGYEGMFYASKSEIQDEAQWETSRIEKHYKIWVAQYPAEPYPATERSSYTGGHHMWQYATDASVSGISQNVDRNVAYFGYDGVKDPQNPEPPEPAQPDPEALMRFREVNEPVTAKEAVNLRSIPDQGEDSQVLCQLQNGEVATRIAVSDSGWSKVVYEGTTCYAVSSLLTTDLDYTVPAETEDDGIKTEFTEVSEKVTAKIEVNLRTLPSVEHPDSQVVVTIKNGEVVTRTGINEDVGWSRVEYNGQTLYCVSSYLTSAE